MRPSPMKNKKQTNLSKKGQHTFLNHQRFIESDHTRDTGRKCKQVQRWEAWI